MNPSSVELLILLEFGKLTNSKISRILRRYDTAVYYDLSKLYEKGLVGKNSELEYFITEEGKKLISKSEFLTPYYQELREHVKRLKENPEPKGWIPNQLDLGGITTTESEILYMFEKNDNLTNTEIAKTLKRASSATWQDLQSLVQKELIIKNPDNKYYLSSKGIERISFNIAKNTRCKLTEKFVKNLKTAHNRRGSWKYEIAVPPVLSTLGLTKSSNAESISSTSIPSGSPVSHASFISSATTTTSANTTAPATTLPFLSTKPILIPILTVMIVAGGIFVVEPEIIRFGIEDVNSPAIPITSSSSNTIQDNVEFSASSNTDVLSSEILPKSISSNGKSKSVQAQQKQIQQKFEIEENITKSDIETILSEDATTQPTMSPESNGSGGNSSPTVTDPVPIAPATNIPITSIPTRGIPTNTIVLSLFVEVTTPFGIAFDKNDFIYVSSYNSDTIEKFDSDGNFIKTIGEPGSGDGQFNDPSEIDFDSNNHLYIVDNNNRRVQKFDSDGNFIMKFGELGRNDGQFMSPRYLAIDKNDYVYVVNDHADTNRVQKFDSDGNFIMKFGEPGSGDGQFQGPTGIAIDSKNNIYVADYLNHRIQKFDSDGSFISSFSNRGSGDGQFNFPTGILIDENDDMYISDRAPSRVQKFDSDGNFIMKFGEPGSGDGQFNIPTTLIITKNGNLYVVDSGNNRVQEISFEDALITFSEQFDQVKCDADSMITAPLAVPIEISSVLPQSELLSRANSLADTEQFEQAMLFYYITSQIQPDNIHAWTGIGYTQTFVCDNNSPITAYNHVLNNLDSKNVNSFNGLGLYYENKAHNNPFPIIDAKTAESHYRLALQIDPDNINSLNGVGNSLVLQDNYEGAIAMYQKSLDIDDKRVTTLNGMAYAQFRADNGHEAITFYNKALDIEENNFDALSGLFTIYTLEKQDDLALKIVGKLSEHNKQVAENLVNEGLWLQQNGQEAEAQKLFEAALKLDPGNQQIQNLIK